MHKTLFSKNIFRVVNNVLLQYISIIIYKYLLLKNNLELEIWRRNKMWCNFVICLDAQLQTYSYQEHTSFMYFNNSIFLLNWSSIKFYAIWSLNYHLLNFFNMLQLGSTFFATKTFSYKFIKLHVFDHKLFTISNFNEQCKDVKVTNL
jgi:hypothetical protein